jgi:tRNA G10  N-methylase Trm11
MEFLVRLVQQHESFRKPELEALGQLHNLELKFVTYNETVGSIFHAMYAPRTGN